MCPQSNFERGSIDTFVLNKHPKLGPLTHLTISHNNKGHGPGFNPCHLRCTDETGQHAPHCKRHVQIWNSKWETECGCVQKV